MHRIITKSVCIMVGRVMLWLCALLSFSHITTSEAMVYLDYDIASDRVCSHLGKRELSISMSRPLLVREGGRLLSNWPGIHSFSCRWEIESKGRGQGVVAVVQKVKFRRLGLECVDYLQFKEDGDSNRGPRICGSMLFGLHLGNNDSLPPPPPAPLPPNPPTTPSTTLSILSTFFKGAYNPWSPLVARGAVVDPKGELKTYIYVANRPIKSDEKLELVIAYSGYQACDGNSHSSSLFHCGYGLCISRALVYDGVVNCPFGDCVDEGSCSLAKASNLTARILGHSTAKRTSGGVGTGVTATSSFFAIAILVIIGACICFILRRNKKRREAQDTTEEVTYPPQTGNGEYVGVPTNAGMQSGGPTDGQPIMPPGAPPPGQGPANIGFVLPDAGTPYPPAGAPYPGAGAPYPGAGAPYPGAGAPYPSAGAPYPGAGAPYPGAGAPYPGAGPHNPGTGTPYPGAGAPYPSGNTPYPVQPPPNQPPTSGPDASAPSAPTQEQPPPYSALFPQQKM